MDDAYVEVWNLCKGCGMVVFQTGAGDAFKDAGYSGAAPWK